MDKLDPSEHAIEMPTRHSRERNQPPRLAIPLGSATMELVRQETELYDFKIYEPTTEEKVPRIKANVSDYMQGQARSSDTELRPHQRSVFDDLSSFINSIDQEDRSGFVRLPTATGKTVVFVELCKALLGQEPDPQNPRILVVAPTKDLVNQTVGTNLSKGFSRFAPDIKTSSYYSDTESSPGNSKSKQIRDSQVCVTTYSSFGRMFSDPEINGIGVHYTSTYEMRPGETRTANHFIYPKTGRNIIDMFDVFIFDEAHNTLGEVTRNRVEQLKARGKICVGFTATSNYSKAKDLSSLLVKEIHTMDPAEAIEENLLSPIVPITVLSGKNVDEEDILSFTGEYSDEKLKFLGYDEDRNELIVSIAATLLENGILPVISCVAGKDKFHPKHIAELLGKVEITDYFTGRRHRIRAAAIDSDMPTKERIVKYAEFEAGPVDALSFINILTEGWDSERAKALINARPTRSKVFAQQRLGRVLRLTDEHAPLSFVIDILDNFKEYPPVLSADLLYKEPIEAGTVIGRAADYDESFVQNLVKSVAESIGKKGAIASTTLPLFSEHEAIMAAYEQSGQYMKVEELGPNDEIIRAEFATSDYLDERNIVPYLTDDIIQRLEDDMGPIDARVTRRGYNIQTLYDVDDVKRAVAALPEVDPERALIDDDHNRWLSAVGFKILLKKHFPRTTVEDIRVTLEGLETEGVIGRSKLAKYDHSSSPIRKIYGCLKLYREETYKALARELKNKRIGI